MLIHRGRSDGIDGFGKVELQNLVIAVTVLQVDRT